MHGDKGADAEILTGDHGNTDIVADKENAINVDDVVFTDIIPISKGNYMFSCSHISFKGYLFFQRIIIFILLFVIKIVYDTSIAQICVNYAELIWQFHTLFHMCIK